MRTQRVPVTTKCIVAVFLVLVPVLGVAKEKASMNHQLTVAATRGDLPGVKRLLTKGVYVNALDQYGLSALVAAAKGGHLGILRLLIENGGDVNVKENSGTTALMAAAWRPDLEAVRLLLEMGADVNAWKGNGWTALRGAAAHGHLEMVKLLLNKGAHPEVNGCGTALMGAAGQGYLEVAKILVANGADVNAKAKDGSTALMKAAGHGHLEVLKVLVANGAEINAKAKDGSTALMAAAAKYYGQEEHGPSLRRSLLILFNFLRNGSLGPWRQPRRSNRDPEVVKFLLQNGAQINARTDDGWTALSRARKGGTPGIVEVLKAHGAEE